MIVRTSPTPTSSAEWAEELVNFRNDFYDCLGSWGQGAA
jgi:hypothetical protein